MKSIKELTRSEIAALSDEQLDLYLQKELMDKGYPINIFEEKKELVDKPTPVDNVYVVESGYYASLAFKDVKDAEAAVDAINKGFSINYDYISTQNDSASYYYKDGVRTKASIKSISLFNREDLDKYKSSVTKKEDVDKRVDGAREVRSEFWSFIYKAIEEYSFNVGLIPVLETYMKILDGDKDKSIEVMKQSYKFNDETESVLRSVGSKDSESEAN